MGWTAHQVVLRLCSPMHIGAGKVGNLQRTRRYVAGRNLWGALTARLARDGDPLGEPDPTVYEELGHKVQDELAFTYLYPTVRASGTVDLRPWDDGFSWQFLSTYASTALDYASVSAEEASLHEVECIMPHTRDGAPVWLSGYVFQRAGSTLYWQGALRRLQIGGERGYGWGLVRPVETLQDSAPLSGAFGYHLRLDGRRPIVSVPAGGALLAHALAADFEQGDGGRCFAVPEGSVEGTVEPLVGRQTGPDTRFGVHLSRARVSYAPGSHATAALDVQIGAFGVWEGIP